jgi:hypothetical protein
MPTHGAITMISAPGGDYLGGGLFPFHISGLDSYKTGCADRRRRRDSLSRERPGKPAWPPARRRSSRPQDAVVKSSTERPRRSGSYCVVGPARFRRRISARQRTPECAAAGLLDAAGRDSTRSRRLRERWSWRTRRRSPAGARPFRLRISRGPPNRPARLRNLHSGPSIAGASVGVIGNANHGQRPRSLRPRTRLATRSGVDGDGFHGQGGTATAAVRVKSRHPSLAASPRRTVTSGNSLVSFNGGGHRHRRRSRRFFLSIFSCRPGSDVERGRRVQDGRTQPPREAMR